MLIDLKQHGTQEQGNQHANLYS